MTIPLCLALASLTRAASPTAEFDEPYAVRIMPGGEVIEISGSFSWAMPQNFVAVLAGAPNVRTIRLESPGGHLRPALQIADVIRARGLDTFVGRLCASACTLAWLGGHQRYLAPGARLGFHQAHAPGLPPAMFDPMLRAAYVQDGVPAAFIDHVLRTPPSDIWFPDQAELHKAGFLTAPPPPDLIAQDVTASAAWGDGMRQLPVTSDAALARYAVEVVGLIDQVQGRDPEVCWRFFHNETIALSAYAAPDTLVRMEGAMTQVRADAGQGAALDPERRLRLVRTLIAAVRTPANTGLIDALRAGADHAQFCPALRLVLTAALALPDADRGPTLRALLAGG